MPQVLFAGLTTVDIQYFVDQFPGPNQKLKCAPPDVLVGGPAANAAAGFAFLQGGATLLTAIGNNSFSQFILDDFEVLNIHAIDFVNCRKIDPVVAAVITSPNGDRTILSHHPVDLPFVLDFDNLLNQLKPEAILVDGFYPAMTLALCHSARQQKIPVVFDGGSWKAHLDGLLPFLDIVICSADFMPPSCFSHSGVLDFFRERGIQKVAISRGADPILFCEEGEIGEIPVEKGEVVDTLGAGDFLHGAFCYYWTKNFDFAESLRKASQFATVTCSYHGTRSCFKELSPGEFL